MILFNDETCEKLFGAEDAENETLNRFKQYFFYNKTYDNLISTLPIRILVGHKGVGKSALLKRAFLDDKENNILSVWLQPTAFDAPKDSSSFVQQVDLWKKHLLKVIGIAVIEEIRSGAADSIDIPEKITKNTGKWIALITEKIRAIAEENLEGTTETLVNSFLQKKEIRVYIDDIDRGWSASKDDIRDISALLNAIRDLTGEEQRLKFRIALRSDVYFLVRTSDESTDKIERNVVWLNWENHEILCIMAKRIETYFGNDIDQDHLLKMSQKDISQEILSKVITPVFEGAGHWSKRSIHNVLLSLTRKRPRDLVKLMHAAAKNAYNKSHDIINTLDLEDIFESYSNERLQDIINEYRSEMPQIEALLLGMRPTTKQRKTKENFHFTNDEIIKKIKSILQNNTITFKNGKPVTSKAILQFLYKIEFITARIDKPNGTKERKFFDQSRFLANEMTDFGYNWEIHPAYRWALQPQDIFAIFETLDS